jgi:AraC family transcriptional regulator, transcriptional activator of pobA
MQDTLTLINPQNGNLAFKIFSFEDNCAFDHVQRVNYYSLIWIKNGKGKCNVDFHEFDFAEKTLFAFSPYQPFMFSSNEKIEGIAIQFHSDFYCIHMHQKEVACNGVLFNTIYEPPFTYIDTVVEASFHLIIDQMKTEMQNPALAQYELLVSYLKIFLINASRLKTQQQSEIINKIEGLREPFILQNLKDAIEKDFKVKHSASDYADTLNISAKALAKITKAYFNKTLTNLISERIIIEAKRELYLTNKTVKEIAFDLGYNDEHYFSRFFKINADVSPQMYRETVGFGKGNF